MGLAPGGSPWSWFTGEPPEAEPIARPSRAVKAALRKDGLVHDEGAGTFLGRTVVERGGSAAGTVGFRPADGGEFWVAAAVEGAGAARAAAPTRAGKPKPARAEPVVDAAKDKALLDAFSAAIATAMSTS